MLLVTKARVDDLQSPAGKGGNREAFGATTAAWPPPVLPFTVFFPSETCDLSRGLICTSLTVRLGKPGQANCERIPGLSRVAGEKGRETIGWG